MFTATSFQWLGIVLELIQCFGRLCIDVLAFVLLVAAHHVKGKHKWNLLL
jgi:hypothetical protein